METKTQESQDPSPASRTFPDPSITLVEFGDAAGLLLAQRTERVVDKRRLLLQKVAYVRLEEKTWGISAYPEVWIEQNAEGLFVAIDAATGKVFHDPSRRRYEVAFMSNEIFNLTIQCLKERKAEPIYELMVVSFALRPGFSAEKHGLLAPDDYAAERSAVADNQWVPYPPRFEDAP
ncbi:MAG: hypothetical protein M1457_07330 [bacterium]|nr:hypothetical protein [bacterium]